MDTHQQREAGGHVVQCYERDEVCHLHTAVVPTADVGEVEAARTFAKSVQAPRAARRFVVDALEKWGRTQLSDDASLVVSELATNAVLHAHSDFTVALTLADGGIRVEVKDANQQPPVLQATSATEVSGRGVALVGALADEWGSYRLPAGKIVWAVLR